MTPPSTKSHFQGKAICIQHGAVMAPAVLRWVFNCRPARSATAAWIQASTAFQSSLLTSARPEKRLPPSCSSRASSIFPQAQKWAYDLQHLSTLTRSG